MNQHNNTSESTSQMQGKSTKIEELILFDLDKFRIESKENDVPRPIAAEKTIPQFQNEHHAIAGIMATDIKNEAERMIKEGKDAGISQNLKTVLATQKKLKEIKATDIKFSDPVLRQGENAVLFPHTINIIQGQAGVHKSRLAEYICAAFLKRQDCENDLLGFSRINSDVPYTVVYVDTERNLSEQLPYALQSIQVKAGYNITDHPRNFLYISLLQISRKDRYTVLNEYLTYTKQNTSSPLFIVLDVSTDCIEDFNRADKSMELIDLMNVTINQHNVIFLCLIHENPGGEKARGHFGTELKNKSSTVIQVAFEKDSSKEDTDLIRVKYLKCRSTARHTPFHIRYSEVAKGLVLADPNDVAALFNSRKSKALVSDVVEAIELFLGDGKTLMRSQLINELSKRFDSSQRTIESRIVEVMTSEVEIHNNNGDMCKLNKHTKDKVAFYSLIPVEYT